MLLRNDGCLAHYARDVRNYLDETYHRRWIGRLGPILWPPRSPDLNPLDFYYWGCIKEKVYANPINDVEELRHRIYEAAQQINVARSARLIKRAFIKRCKACIRLGGRQFEHVI